MNIKNIVSEKIRRNEILRNLKNSGILSLVVVGIVLMLSGSVHAYSGGGGTCNCGDALLLLVEAQQMPV